MEDNLDPEAGTTLEEGAGGDGAGTTPDSDAGGLSDDKVSIPRHEYEALRRKAESDNANAREIAEIKARLDAVPPPTTGVRGSSQDEYFAMREREINRLRQLGEIDPATGRPANADAFAVVSVLEQAEDLNRITAFKLELAEVPKEQRDAVKQVMKERRLASPLQALELVNGSRIGTVEAENQRLKEENERLKKAAAAPRNPVAPTRIVGQGAGPKANDKAAEEITLGEFRRRLASNDPAVRRETNQAQQSGKLKVRAG